MDCRLQASDLAVGWENPLIRGISLELPPGETLAVIGESGCGKSTLLSTLAGIRKPLAGEVRWLAGAEGDAPAAPKRAMVWQDLALLPWKTVRDNLALPLVLEGAPDVEARVREMLEEMELSPFADRYPASLSGGQRQRLALGRAFIARPGVLFMDEPFSALDAILRERLQDFLKSQWRRLRCSIVFVTHDMAEAAFLGQQILLLGARPSRVAALARNSAFSAGPDDVRATEGFYRVQRHLYEALSAVREGRDANLAPGGQW